MLFEHIADKLGWPAPSSIFTPKSSSLSLLAELAQQKIKTPLLRQTECHDVRVGILALAPDAHSTETPLAIILHFSQKVSEQVLTIAHKLAWNFCRSPLLITVEPHLLRAWTCYEPPSKESKLIGEIPGARLDLETTDLALFVSHSLHWVTLSTGNFFSMYEEKFDPAGRADSTLLSNFRALRSLLLQTKLSEDIIHDLLGRVIFIQFLFHRTDSSGNAALNANFLNRLSQEGVIKNNPTNLAEILESYEDAYRFFKWLNEKFNGDLFPGKGATKAAREREWEAEMEQVTSTQLDLLAQFVRGDIDLGIQQLALFPLYSFDTIPLEFISSIYEEFVSSKQDSIGAHYTPSFVVDFILDSVLPWHGRDWNLRILDPACGSGIFLVKAFQRLVKRWIQSHPHVEISPKVLRMLLRNNICGVDSNPHAIRVASFSLYLAMCDEIDPKYYWRKVKFPRLRDHQLLTGDFFKIADDLKIKRFDIVVGNAPWGKDTITPEAKKWASEFNWNITYNSIGPLFLPRLASISKSKCVISMLQPLGLIMNTVQTAYKFRKKLFEMYSIQEIVNLGALRFGLFENAIAPACIVTMNNKLPSEEDLITYITPKATKTNTDQFQILIEPHDIHQLTLSETLMEQLVWTVLMWGQRRDLLFIKRLTRYESLAKLRKRDIAKTRQGVIRGDRKKKYLRILNRRFLDFDPSGFSIELQDLPLNEDPYVDSRASTSLEAFKLPQLVIKQSWTSESGRFKAWIVKGKGDEGVVCSQSYYSVHIPANYFRYLQAAWLCYSSKIAVYFLFLTSSRFASYRPSVNTSDLLLVPLPPGINESFNFFNIQEIDKYVSNAFSMTFVERVLLEDMFNYTLQDFKGNVNSPGRLRTTREFSKGIEEPELKSYSELLIKALKAGFGANKQIFVNIFQESSTLLPVRLIAIVLDGLHNGIKIEKSPLADLWSKLQLLTNILRNSQNETRGVVYQRTARIYSVLEVEGQRIPAILIIKPDQVRYWTRSIALRDADEISADIVLWHESRTTHGRKSQKVKSAS